MGTQHLPADERIALARAGGVASGKVARAKRIAFWVKEGVPYEIGMRIYEAGYHCAYQEKRRKKSEATS